MKIQIDRPPGKVMVLLALMGFVLAADARSGDAQTIHHRHLKDLPYVSGADADPAQVADLYLPEGATNAPVVLFIHGGGWRAGDKAPDGFDRFVQVFLRQGMAVASINYRLSPKVKHPAHIEDVARAAAWLLREGRTYGLDPARLWLAGHSAGAHLAALLALDPSYLQKAQVPASAIKGVMAISGVYDLGDFPEPGVVPTRMEQGFGTDRAFLRSASPATLVGAPNRAATPPFLITFTDNDLFGLAEQAKTFYALFLQRNLPAQLVEVPSRTHLNVVSGIAQRLDGADDVLGPALADFVRTVNDGSFARVKDITSSRMSAQQMPSPSMKAVRDIRYYEGPGSDAKLNALDLFLPEGKTNVPVVFYVHGGRWRAGDKGTPQTLIDIFGRMGMAVVSTNYRISPAVKHPTHIEDVARAFGWMYQNAGKYSINRNRIYIVGTSAGGHLVSLLGADTRRLQAVGVPPGAIKGVMSISGIYDMPNWWEPGKVPSGREQGFDMDQAAMRDASPLLHVSRTSPPYLLTVTDHDLFLLKEQALELYRVLKTAGVRTRLVQVPDRTHFDQMDGIGIQIGLVEDVLGPALVRFVMELESGPSPAGGAAGAERE